MTSLCNHASVLVRSTGLPKRPAFLYGKLASQSSERLLNISPATRLNSTSSPKTEWKGGPSYTKRRALRTSTSIYASSSSSDVETGHASGSSAHECTVLLGIDFGGSGIKAAPVEISTGLLLEERLRIETPVPATPEAVANVLKELQAHFKWTGCVGVGMPSVVKQGRVNSAANIDKSWIDVDAKALFQEATGCPVAVINDADAAGYAEMAFGAGKGLRNSGVALLATFGTGIGTALFVDGTLVPNLEFGHIEVDGIEAEKWASDRIRTKEDLSWKKWAARVNAVLARYEQLLQPDLIIIGGGVSKKDDKFLHLLEMPGGTPVVAAGMRNEAGIVGAAVGGANILHLRDRVHEKMEEAEEQSVVETEGGNGSPCGGEEAGKVASHAGHSHS
eukprot:TRINITY_DN9220_c0_g1_i5.p1 TRINITY_DN9220_c0_g1~~TRINITY_DN9220_c0_g1_i5.p1  ORF type:complete len:391 (+),score=63.84 TRINITY_DN9220_c0_g1_i5:138-1310(+)